MSSTEHTTEMVFWESSARGQTYVGRCSCRWYGDKHKDPADARLDIQTHERQVNGDQD